MSTAAAARPHPGSAGRRWEPIPWIMGAALMLAMNAPASTQSLRVELQDHRGQPIDDAVVSAVPVAPSRPAKATAELRVMDQVDESFAPHILVVPKGTPVSFPNHDDVRHHVYSFSEAKTFELPLYEGTPTDPVLFDQSGVVVLGCNIHDWMRGYIYVTEAPHTGRSTDGTALLPLPPGDYRIEVWHPRLRAKENWSGNVTVLGSGETALQVELRLKPALKIRRAPRAGKTKY